MAKGRSFLVNVFHGVSVHPGSDCACTSVDSLSGVRYLSADAPMLPLDNCETPGRCRCTYKHYQDRRSSSRRDSDIGLPVSRMSLQEQEEKRLGIGRRITDAA